jgi:2,3-bisphosphoglycerate-independent phosphoglycerate mutase
LLEEQTPDFICLNFANPDMVGHTGVFDAAVKAVETIDNCAESVTQTALAHDYTIMITADHGNSDYLINDDGSPNTAHTKNPVPFFLLNAADGTRVSDGKLGDIAPTVLKLMGLDVPGEMTGKALVDDK